MGKTTLDREIARILCGTCRDGAWCDTCEMEDILRMLQYKMELQKKEKRKLKKKQLAYLRGYDDCIRVVDGFLSDPAEWSDLVDGITGDWDEDKRRRSLALLFQRLSTRLALRRNELELCMRDADGNEKSL